MERTLNTINENYFHSIMYEQRSELSGSSQKILKTLIEVSDVLTEKVIEHPTEITEYVISAYMMLIEIGIDVKKIDNDLIQNHIVSLRETTKAFFKLKQL